MTRWIGSLVVLIVFLQGPAALAQGLSTYRRPEVSQAIARLTREAIWAALADRPYTPSAIPAALDQPVGVFVTLSRAGATRGCWGTVAPRAGSAAQEIATNAAKALTLDYRQRPIRAAELPDMVAHVSIVGPLEPVSGPGALQPRRYGLLVSGQGKGGVLLPGEAATARWQIETCRRKAGLRPRERASLYRFETTVIGPIALTPPRRLP